MTGCAQSAHGTSRRVKHLTLTTPTAAGMADQTTTKPAESADGVDIAADRERKRRDSFSKMTAKLGDEASAAAEVVAVLSCL